MTDRETGGWRIDGRVPGLACSLCGEPIVIDRGDLSPGDDGDPRPLLEDRVLICHPCWHATDREGFGLYKMAGEPVAERIPRDPGQVPWGPIPVAPDAQMLVIR